MCLLLGQYRSLCEVDGTTIVLDVREDRYWQLSPRLAAALSRVIRQTGDASSQDAAAVKKAGLLPELSDQDHFQPCSTISRPTNSVFDQRSPYIVLDGVGAAYALARTAAALRAGKFHKELDSIRRLKLSVGTATDQDKLASTSRAFNKTMRIFGWEGKCLIHGLAITRFFASRGIAVTLILGVTVRPFSAHCWAQSGTLVLSDRVESVLNYTPILVL